MMLNILDYIVSDAKWFIATVISLLALFFAFLRIRIMSRKDKIDRKEFETKKPNFQLYFHQGYRLFDKEKENLRFLLANIDISNKSSTKITVSPYIYIKLKNFNEKIKLYHNKNLFLPGYHDKIEKLENNISIEERGIKSGWIITRIPKDLIDKRIEYIEIYCEDTNGTISKVEVYILKDIFYEIKNE